MKKMEELGGKAPPPFTKVEGSADRPRGIPNWFYVAGLGVAGAIAGILYRNKQGSRG
jgi:hypothetical protein